MHVAETRKKAEEPPAPATKPLCSVAFCPICTTVAAVQQVSPETVEHLLAAAREFLLAAKSVIDARAADLEGDGRPAKLERIDIA